MIVLDACVLIAHMDADDADHDRATALLLVIADESLAASPVTLAETLVGPGRSEHLDPAMRALDQLNITSVGFEPDAPSRLALLRAGTGLKLPDCCVLMAAEQVHGAVASFDDRLVGAARSRGIPVRN